MTNQQTLHFRIAYPPAGSPAGTPNLPLANQPRDWFCQVDPVEESGFVRVILHRPHNHQRSSTRGPHCTLCVLTDSGHARRVLLVKRIQPERAFHTGVEFWLDENQIMVNGFLTFAITVSSLPIKLLGPVDCKTHTHPLPATFEWSVLTNPLMELMTKVLHHPQSGDVSIVARAHPSSSATISLRPPRIGLQSIRAHKAILSIYPRFSMKLLAQRRHDEQWNLEISEEEEESFPELMWFVYLGVLSPRSRVLDLGSWDVRFRLAEMYCDAWGEVLAKELKGKISHQTVLPVFFGWAYQYPRAAAACVAFAVEHCRDNHFGELYSTVILREVPRYAEAYKSVQVPAGAADFIARSRYFMEMFFQMEFRSRHGGSAWP